MSRLTSMHETPTVADSLVRADVMEAANRPGPYPKFTDIPSMPRDVRPLAEWRAAVQSVSADGQQLAAQVAAAPPTLNNTEGFAAASRERAEAPPAPAAISTEEFLAQSRAKAKPPAPPK
ncbi:MAG: hypothetical protein ACXWVJ_05015 [Caulobacteraceae bacterium]